MNKVYYGWKYERLEEKAKWFRGLSATKRYEAMVAMSDLFNIFCNKNKRKVAIARRAFKTIQVLG